MARSDPVPATGETLLFSDAGRWRPPLWSFVLLLTAPALWIAGVGFAPHYLEHPWPVAIAFAGFLLFLIPLDVFLLGRWLERWRVAVTDRRVLQRKGPFGLRRIELDLSRLEDIQHDWRNGRLILATTNRILSIRCDEAVAQEILKALSQARKRQA